MDADVPGLVIARLRAQLATMPVIEQAKGIVMARVGCAPEEAFDLLRRGSQRANLKLAVLAAFLVEQAMRKPASMVAASEPEGGAMTAGSGGDEPIAGGRSRRRSAGQVPAGPRPGTAVVPLPGELAFSNADQVEAALTAGFGPGIRTVVADGTPTLFCDSAGIRELVKAHQRATAAGIDFRVVAAHHYLRDRLVRTGLDAYLSLYATVAEAVPAEAATELPGG